MEYGICVNGCVNTYSIFHSIIVHRSSNENTTLAKTIKKKLFNFQNLFQNIIKLIKPFGRAAFMKKILIIVTAADGNMYVAKCIRQSSGEQVDRSHGIRVFTGID